MGERDLEVFLQRNHTECLATRAEREYQHLILNVTSRSSACDIQSALSSVTSYRAKFIAGSYILHSNRARFNQFKVDPTCPLCGNDKEDMTHMLAVCTSLQHSRTRNVNKIKNKHNAKLQRTGPGTKLIGEFSTRGRIFPPNARNGF